MIGLIEIAILNTARRIAREQGKDWWSLPKSERDEFVTKAWEFAKQPGTEIKTVK